MFEFNATLIISMISFVVFMSIMNAIFYRPILNIIRKRDEFVSQNYSQAEALASEAQNIKNDYESKLADVKEQGRIKVANEFEKVQKDSFEKTQNAKEQTRLKIQENKKIINAEKDKLYDEINSKLINDLSSNIVNKIVG